MSASHTLKVDKVRKLEEVVIAAHTPGVLIKAEPKRLYVSLEPPVEGQRIFVMFEFGHNRDREGYFMYPDKMEEQGTMLVNYGEKGYTASAECRIARLPIDQDKVKVSTEESRQVPGRLLPDPPKK